MRGLLSADDDGAVRVMHDVVGDGAHDGAADGAESSGAHDDHVGVHVARSANQRLARLLPVRRLVLVVVNDL